MWIKHKNEFASKLFLQALILLFTAAETEQVETTTAMKVLDKSITSYFRQSIYAGTSHQAILPTSRDIENPFNLKSLQTRKYLHFNCWLQQYSIFQKFMSHSDQEEKI